MVELTALLGVLAQDPVAFHGITLEKLMNFVVYAGKLKNDILLTQPVDHPATEPPDHLPRSIENFLNRACGLVEGQAAQCWAVVKGMVWDGESLMSEETNEAAFREHGHDMGISWYSG